MADLNLGYSALGGHESYDGRDYELTELPRSRWVTKKHDKVEA